MKGNFCKKSVKYMLVEGYIRNGLKNIKVHVYYFPVEKSRNILYNSR